LRCKTLRWTREKDTVCVQTCKRRDPALRRAARFMNKVTRQMRLYTAMANLGEDARLTAFRSARNIVRIRTNDDGRADAAIIGALNEQACS
jgi:hypothetical protein